MSQVLRILDKMRDTKSETTMGFGNHASGFGSSPSPKRARLSDSPRDDTVGKQLVSAPGNASGTREKTLPPNELGHDAGVPPSHDLGSHTLDASANADSQNLQEPKPEDSVCESCILPGESAPSPSVGSAWCDFIADLDFSPGEIWNCFERFQQDACTGSIIPHSYLRDLVTEFVDDFAPSRGNMESTTRKRKRGAESTTGNALVLMVLALGTLSLHETKTPGRGPSQGNCGGIPGLEYVTAASNILRKQPSGATMQGLCVRALAVLYHGRIFRAKECWSYISDSSDMLFKLLTP